MRSAAAGKAKASVGGRTIRRVRDHGEGVGTRAVFRADDYDAMLFDMDGVITRSANCHGRLWKLVFDDFLKAFSERHNLPFRPFDEEADYHDFVDGKPRYDGVSSFLATRGIMIPFGEPTDDDETETCCGLGNKKNRMFLNHIESVGVEVFETTIAFIRELRGRGRKIAVVSASKNADAVLRNAGILDLFDAMVSGREAAAMSLAGKPAPDTYLKAAELLEISPGRSAVFEDSVVGVQAAKKAGAGAIIGIDRADDRGALLWHGADVVVADLSELTLV